MAASLVCASGSALDQQCALGDVLSVLLAASERVECVPEASGLQGLDLGVDSDMVKGRPLGSGALAEASPQL